MLEKEISIIPFLNGHIVKKSENISNIFKYDMKPAQKLCKQLKKLQNFDENAYWIKKNYFIQFKESKTLYAIERIDYKRNVAILKKC